MKAYTLFFVFLLASLSALAQRTLTVSGKAVDAENGEPLIFASVGIQGQPLGTITNSEGQFDFHFPEKFRNGTFVISMLGYVDYKAPVSSLLNNDSLIFRLTKAAQLLDEVVISDSLSGGDIARIALNRIPKNFPTQPYLLDGFYRDLKKVGGTYFSLLEAAVKIYDEGYIEPKNKFRLRERVALTEVRKSIGYNNKFTKFFDQTNLLEDLLLRNDIRYYRYPDMDAFFDIFKRLRTSYFNGHIVHVVAAEEDDFKLKMFIRVEDYAIVRVEHERLYTEAIIKKKRNLVSKYIKDKKSLDFKSYDGRMYLSYINSESHINWYDAKTDELKFETELHQELLINAINQQPEERIKGMEKMRGYGLQYQDESYNKDFWDNYNVIKETPLDKEILADLQRQGVLDDKFENN